MHQQNRVCHKNIQAVTGERELREEELVSVLGGASEFARSMNANSPNNNGANSDTSLPPDTFSNSLLGSLLGYSSESFLNKLMQGNASSGNMSPFGFLGF